MNETQFPPRPTALAQALLSPLIGSGDTVIDGTAGNGHDVEFLAERVGELGRVLAFDVQLAALAMTRKRLHDCGLMDRVDLIHESHCSLDRHVGVGTVSAVMLNLGYLPGADHAITTDEKGTLSALGAIERVLRPGGVLSVICYPGHLAGVAEAEAVEAWFQQQAIQGWRVAKYGAIGTRKPAPFLLMARSGGL